MSDHHDCAEHECERECTLECAATCPEHAHPTVPSLAVVRERFEREVQRGICDTGRYRCPYVVWGKGPPLVFIHGPADNAKSFLLPMSLLAPYFRCIAYDLPTGHDGADLKRLTHADLVADLWALLDHCGCPQSYLFASSFGATIALAALHAQPKRLPRAVLQGAAAHKPLSRLGRPLARLMSRCPGSMSALPFRRLFLRRIHHASFADRPSERWSYFLDCTGEIPIRAVGRQARILHRVDLRPLLPEIRQPIMLVYGDSDPIVGSEASETLLHGLPSAGRIILQNCGRLPSFTHPEAIAEIVYRFLTPPSAESKRVEIAECRVER